MEVRNIFFVLSVDSVPLLMLTIPKLIKIAEGIPELPTSHEEGVEFIPSAEEQQKDKDIPLSDEVAQDIITGKNKIK